MLNHSNQQSFHKKRNKRVWVDKHGSKRRKIKRLTSWGKFKRAWFRWRQRRKSMHFTVFDIPVIAYHKRYSSEVQSKPHPCQNSDGNHMQRPCWQPSKTLLPAHRCFDGQADKTLNKYHCRGWGDKASINNPLMEIIYFSFAAIPVTLSNWVLRVSVTKNVALSLPGV